MPTAAGTRLSYRINEGGTIRSADEPAEHVRDGGGVDLHRRDHRARPDGDRVGDADPAGPPRQASCSVQRRPRCRRSTRRSTPGRTSTSSAPVSTATWSTSAGRSSRSRSGPAAATASRRRSSSAPAATGCASQRPRSAGSRSERCRERAPVPPALLRDRHGRPGRAGVLQDGLASRTRSMPARPSRSSSRTPPAPDGRRCPSPSQFAVTKWRDEVAGAADLTEDADQFAAAGIPLGWVIIDNPWEAATCVGSMSFDPRRFPDPTATIGGAPCARASA